MEKRQKLDHTEGGEEEDPYFLYFDGAAKPNPGLGGAGWIIQQGRNTVAAGVKYMGEETTNNEAEYQSLIEGLKFFNSNDSLAGKKLSIRGDSMLVVHQLNREWKVKKESLKPFFAVADKLLDDNMDIAHIPREENALADELSNVAIASKDSFVVTEGIPADVSVRFLRKLKKP